MKVTLGCKISGPMEGSRRARPSRALHGAAGFYTANGFTSRGALVYFGKELRRLSKRPISGQHFNDDLLEGGRR